MHVPFACEQHGKGRAHAQGKASARLGWGCSDEARVDQAGEFDTGNVSACREDAVELPNCFCRCREVVCKEAAACPTHTRVTLRVSNRIHPVTLTVIIQNAGGTCTTTDVYVK